MENGKVNNYIEPEIKENVEHIRSKEQQEVVIGKPKNSLFVIPEQPIGVGSFGGNDAVAGRKKRDPTSLKLEAPERRVLTEVPKVPMETKRLQSLLPELRAKDTKAVTQGNEKIRFNLTSLAIDYNKSHIEGYKAVEQEPAYPMHLVDLVPKKKLEKEVEKDINPKVVEKEAQKFKDGYHKQNTEEGSQTVLERAPDAYIPTVRKAKGFARAGYSRGGYRGMRKTVKFE